jgi:hypothetical protein
MIDTDEEDDAAAAAAKSMKPSRTPLWVALTLASLLLPPILCQVAEWQREAEILRDGTPAKARVADIRPTGNMFNDQPEVTISMQVQPAAGEPFSAKVVTFMSPVYLPRFQPGALVDVRFDPKKPNDVALVGP